MRFGLYSPPAQTEVFSSLPNIATQPSKSSESVFAAFNDSLHKLEQLQTHDMKEQRMRNMELVSNISRQAKDQAMFSMQALKEQLTEELDTMKSEYEDYVEILRRKAEEEERERERLRKLEEERQRVMEEKKRKAAEEEKRKLVEEARKKAEEEERKRIAEAKKAEEKAKAAAEEKKRAEEELKRQKEEEAKKSMKGMTVQTQIQKSILEQHDIIKNIKDNIVNRLDQDKSLKREMNIIKRKINVKLGQLSTSRKQAQSISENIASLVKSVPANSLSYNWLLNFIAKALVSQAETEVTVKSSAAVPLAYIAASLLVNFADFHYYFVARLVKKCCFVIGYTGNIDTENGRLRMGWKRGGDDKWESEVKYEERVAGILSVWASIPQFIDSSGLPLFTWASHWSFLARILNTSQELVSDVHYFIVSNWWEAAAKSFTDRYGKQAGKLLRLATHDWAAYGASKKFGAASRLQVLGEDLQTGNRFNTLKPMED